jgi:hypothetical protein
LSVEWSERSTQKTQKMEKRASFKALEDEKEMFRILFRFT